MRVLGLDLSLTQTAACLVPFDWALDWSRVRTMTVGEKLKKDATESARVLRLQKIKRGILELLTSVSPRSVEVAVIEQYAFTSMHAQAHALGELGGVVKSALHAQGIRIEVVSPGAARKLLGKAPRKDVKIWAAQRLYAAGAPRGWSLDELDAFVVANHYLAENGGNALALEAA